jgi:hypothetical protein
MSARPQRQPATQPLDPGVIKLIEALARAQAAEDHKRAAAERRS